MNTRMSICLLAALLLCRAAKVSSAEAKEQPPATAPESAATPSRQAQPTVQEDLGCIVIDGKTKKIVGVHSADPVSVYVIFEGEDGTRGGRKIPRQELPPQLQAKYPYDAAKAAEYRKQQADLAAEQAAAAAQQAERMRKAAKDGLHQKEQGILAQMESLNKQDVELQKEANVLGSLPPGNGRRVRLRHIHDLQQGIREQNKKLNDQLEQVRAQIAGAP